MSEQDRTVTSATMNAVNGTFSRHGIAARLEAAEGFEFDKAHQLRRTGGPGHAEEFKPRKSMFVWGQVVSIVEFNDFIFIEAHRHVFNGPTGDSSKVDTSTTTWSLYEVKPPVWPVEHGGDGVRTIHDCGRGSSTLDHAILDALAYRHDGINSQAGRMMARMLNIDE